MNSRLAVAFLTIATLAPVAGCSSADEPKPTASTSASTSPPGTSATSTPTTTSGSASSPTVEGAYGCGATDAREITITASGLPDEPVVAQVVFEDQVRNRSEPLQGPDVEVTLMPDLPDEAYEPGAATVRIVIGSEVVVSADVEPELPICG